MLFNSIHFLIFFPVVVGLYFTIRHEYRWILLLAASYYFYAASSGAYLALLLISTLAGYFSALLMGRTSNRFNRKMLLSLGLAVNFGILFLFKYFDFMSRSLSSLFGIFGVNAGTPILDIILPIGISFYTFQIASYVIDVYSGSLKPEPHIGKFAIYVSYFPQLVAGPIERATNLLPQFSERHDFDYKRVTDGLKLMLWGFFKKIVVADRLSIVVSHVYSNVGDFTGFPLMLATVFFAFQIYCDFSGYSDIAIGAAQVMGFRLMDNFRRPYFSRSISEFWTRWHISLSTWFRDYLYIPLGGSRVTIPRWWINIMVVFLVSGLWHGASWTFVLWGALHGFFIVFSLLTKGIREKIVHISGLGRFPKLHFALQLITTFILVNIGWIFFRANSISDVFYVLTHMFSGLSLGFSGITLGGIGYDGLVIAVFSILFMEFVHILQEHMRMRQFLSEKPIWLRWGIYMAIIFSILLFGVFESVQFIYFQF